MVEVIGITATLLVLVSMLFKTTTLKGSILMRLINIIGSVVFVVYGCLLPAISTAILNAGLVLVNSYHLIILLKEQNNIKKNNKKDLEEKSFQEDLKENSLKELK